MRCTLYYVLIEIALAKFAAKVKFVTFSFHDYSLNVLFWLWLPLVLFPGIYRNNISESIFDCLLTFFLKFKLFPDFEILFL